MDIPLAFSHAQIQTSSISTFFSPIPLATSRISRPPSLVPPLAPPLAPPLLSPSSSSASLLSPPSLSPSPSLIKTDPLFWPAQRVWILESVLGPRHYKTLTARNKYACKLQELNHTKEALVVYQKLVDDMLPFYLATPDNADSVVLTPEQTIAILKQTMELAERVCGVENREHTIHNVYKLATLLFLEGRLDESYTYYQRIWLYLFGTVDFHRIFFEPYPSLHYIYAERQSERSTSLPILQLSEQFYHVLSFRSSSAADEEKDYYIRQTEFLLRQLIPPS